MEREVAFGVHRLDNRLRLGAVCGERGLASGREKPLDALQHEAVDPGELARELPVGILLEIHLSGVVRAGRDSVELGKSYLRHRRHGTAPLSECPGFSPRIHPRCRMVTDFPAISEDSATSA